MKEYKIEDHLKNEKEILMYLKEVLEDGDPQLIISALDDIKRALLNKSDLRRVSL